MHEAGHAVIAVLLGKRFKLVTIKPGADGSFGRLLYWTGVSQIIKQVRGEGEYRDLTNEVLDKNARKEIMITYAGFAVEKKAGIVDEKGCGSDFNFITDIAASFQGEEATDFIEECYQCIETLINANWHHIETVAELLIKQTTGSGKQIIQAMSATGYQPFDFNTWQAYTNQCAFYQQKKKKEKKYFKIVKKGFSKTAAT